MQVDETYRPDEYLKMAANMKMIDEICQVYRAINISIRPYRKVSFESSFRLRWFNWNRPPHSFKY